MEAELGDNPKEALLEELQNRMKICHVCPLYGLKYDGPEIALSKGLSLISINDKLLTKLGQSLPFIPTDYEKVTCAIKRTYHMRPDGGLWWVTVVGSNAYLLIQEFLFALRLFKAGNIQLGPLIVSHWLKSWGFKQNAFWRDDFYLEPQRISGMEEAVLDTSEVAEFKRFWHRFRRIKPTKGLRVAVIRFNLAYRNKDPEDRLIDFMIALEALYTGDIQELAYKLALRAAFFLGKTKEELNDVYHVLKKAYAVRSQIVHGQEPKDEFVLKTGKTLDIYDLAKETENILRQSIKKVLMTPQILKQVDLQEYFDQIVLSNPPISDG